MPNGQNRYADKQRKRTPHRGQLVEIGKRIGVVPLVGEYDDVRRWLKQLVEQGLSKDSLRRLGRWCVLMAEAEGFTPATDVLPEVQRALDQYLHQRGILPAEGESGFEPADCLQLDPESPFERWEREAKEQDRQALHVEETEAALKLARKYGELDLVAVLEQHYDPEVGERIKRERHNFTLRYLDVLNATYNRPIELQPRKERERKLARTYGPQTAEWLERRAEVERELSEMQKRSKAQDRRDNRLVGTAMEAHGWEENGIYSAFRWTIQKRGHQLAEDE